MVKKDPSLVSRLKKRELIEGQHRLGNISADDAKYRRKSDPLRDYLSFDAEWRGCAHVQRVLLETRVEYGQAEPGNLAELESAMKKIDTLNMSMIEDELTHHDQLAVIDELGRHVSEETKALLHPGTTSYDILDTARSWLFMRAWNDVIKPEVERSIEKLCGIAERSMDYLQVGRTHLQDTSPVVFGAVLAGYAARFTERMEKCDRYFNDLRGKFSGIVGTGASIDMVIGKGMSEEFERKVLGKLGLKPDYTATQIVQKERVSDCGHGLTSLMFVLRDFANDIRLLYSSAIGEVTSRDNAARLGGSSADAMKNNPINYENIKGKAKVVESGMCILYDMIVSDLQRELSGSVEARYQPQAMMAQSYESFSRLNKALNQLSVNEDRLKQNLLPVRSNPSEAMVAILRGERWVHSRYGVGHDFVKEMGKIARKKGTPLLGVCLQDPEFAHMYGLLPKVKKDILEGQLEKYTGHSIKRANGNIAYARTILREIN